MFKTEDTGRNQPFTTRERGYSLLEVMIIVAIVALLAAIAVPAYRDQTAAARRADGHALLTDIAARLERFYFHHSTYTRDMQALGFGAADNVASTEGYYTASIAAGSAPCPLKSCYSVTATRQGAQTEDTYCGDLTLNSMGQKSVSGSGTVERCW